MHKRFQTSEEMQLKEQAVTDYWL